MKKFLTEKIKLPVWFVILMMITSLPSYDRFKIGLDYLIHDISWLISKMF